MLEGTIISLDATKKQGQVEQTLNKRIFPFAFAVWDGEEYELKEGLNVEFIAENRVITKMKLKISLQDEEAIPVTKSASECVNEFFAREMAILSQHQDFVDGNPELDFMRMRRFLITAYNDLCDLDSLLENQELKIIKNEVTSLYRDFEEYNKKMQYPLPYSFEKIFLVRQVAFTHLEQYIEDVKIAVATAKTESEPLGKRLEEEERSLRLIPDKKSREYLEYEKEVKALRRRFVDLIDYIAKQRDVITRETARLQVFREKHFHDFTDAFLPITDEIKKRFIKLLNTKGYALDKIMWARAKTNQYVKKFFRDADIHGGYNSKTYLRYFLKGLDKKKVVSSKTRELFDLLKTLEASSIQKVFIIQENETKSFKLRQLAERVDSTLKVSVEHNPFEALGKLRTNPQDVVVLDYKNSGLLAFDFIRELKEGGFNKLPVFIVIMSSQLEFTTMEEGRELGVEYYVMANDAEGFSDAIRMVI